MQAWLAWGSFPMRARPSFVTRQLHRQFTFPISGNEGHFFPFFLDLKYAASGEWKLEQSTIGALRGAVSVP